jgi:hypothetical protein
MGLLFDVTSNAQHHLVEHTLDVCIAACLLAAIYTVPVPNADATDDGSTQRSR